MAKLLTFGDVQFVLTVEECDREMVELWRALLLVSRLTKPSVWAQIDLLLDRRNELSGQI